MVRDPQGCLLHFSSSRYARVQDCSQARFMNMNICTKNKKTREKTERTASRNQTWWWEDSLYTNPEVFSAFRRGMVREAGRERQSEASSGSASVQHCLCLERQSGLYKLYKSLFHSGGAQRPASEWVLGAEGESLWAGLTGLSG